MLLWESADMQSLYRNFQPILVSFEKCFLYFVVSIRARTAVCAVRGY